MTYRTPQALRTALEQRLLTQSETTGVALDRLRRRVVFERVACPPPQRGAGQATWRTTVDARLAGKTFGRVKLDISPRARRDRRHRQSRPAELAVIRGHQRPGHRGHRHPASRS